MEQTQEKKICHQKGCKILEGGSCLEGIDVIRHECPHFYLTEVPENDQNNTDDSQSEKKKKNVVQLFTGKEMTFSETEIITNNNDCRLIVIVGESESGKTTLLSEYFINFQKGKFCKYLFAGSLTQIGFEERCFKATIESGNKDPKTERTKSREFSFLHLAVKPESELVKPPRHFLFSDISGETFRDAKTSTIIMKELAVIKAADFVLFLIDGEKIADLNSRSWVIEEAKTFIQKALDERIFDLNTNLKVAMAKWDYLSDDSSFDFESKIQRPFKDRFESRLGTLQFTVIAARSKNSKVPAGLGLCELMEEWDDKDISSTVTEPVYKVSSDRLFQRFTFLTNSL